jgi:uncharacterized protein YecT (DUF1311 family)
MKQILMLITLFLSPLSFAQSFDCKKATTETEKLICSNDELKRLDIELNKLYKQLISNTIVDKDHLRKKQQEWLKTRERSTTYHAMIKAGKVSKETKAGYEIKANLYGDRDNEFKELYKKSPTPATTIAAMYRYRIREFERWVYELSVGTVPGNNSWTEEEQKLFLSMYEAYKIYGFDNDIFYNGADWTDITVDILKLQTEPVRPVAQSLDPNSPEIQKALGDCSFKDIGNICCAAISYYRYKEYRIYKADFDWNSSNGNEILVIGDSAVKVQGYTELPNEDERYTENEQINNGKSYGFYIFSEMDNCSNKYNNALGRQPFFEDKRFPEENFAPTYPARGLSYFTFKADDNVIYGAVRHRGKDYAYMLIKSTDIYILRIIYLIKSEFPEYSEYMGGYDVNYYRARILNLTIFYE